MKNRKVLSMERRSFRYDLELLIGDLTDRAFIAIEEISKLEPFAPEPSPAGHPISREPNCTTKVHKSKHIRQNWEKLQHCVAKRQTISVRPAQFRNPKAPYEVPVGSPIFHRSANTRGAEADRTGLETKMTGRYNKVRSTVDYVLEVL